MKKILCYVHAYMGHGRDAGAETTMANLLESVVRAGWEAEVILTDKTVKPYVLNGVSVRPERDGSDLVEEADKASCLITHLECSERVAILGKLRKIPVVQLVHNTMWQTEGYLNEGCQLAVFNSHWVREFHESDRVDAVGVAYRTDEGTRIDFKSRVPKQWRATVLHPQVEPADYRVAHKGEYITLVNMFASKGAAVFYQLADLFPQEQFLAVEGGYGAQEVIQKPNVTHVPNVSDARKIYAQSKIILMPSKYESFGRVALEAGASGIPTIAAPTPGLEEMLGPEGTFADIEDIDSWSYRLFELLYDEVKYKRAQKHARERSKLWAGERAKETEDLMAALRAITIGR